MSSLSLGNFVEKEIMPGCRVKVVHSDSITFAHWSFEKEALVPEHSHTREHAQILIEGNLELTVNGNSRILKPGSIAIIPPNAKHSVRVMTYCRTIDVSFPKGKTMDGGNSRCPAVES